MRENGTREVIRQVIQQVLREHVAEPFLLLREAGPQARLWCLLRNELVPETVNSEVVLKCGSLHQHTRECKTSRVQLEMKVGSSKKSDIVILRADRKPRLICFPAGPTDVVAALNPDDVEAVIELKASPSRHPGERAAFAADIEKLDALRENHPSAPSGVN
jgi:hypothetical protein